MEQTNIEHFFQPDPKRPRVESMDTIGAEHNKNNTVMEVKSSGDSNATSFTLDQLMSKMSEMIDSKNLAKSEDLVTIKTDIASLNSKYEDLKNEVAILKKEQEIQKLNNERLENDKRNCNLLFFGLNYTKDTLANTLNDVINNKLQIEECVALKKYRPLTRKTNPTNEPVLVTLYDDEDKIKILKNARKLKGTKISVQEDLINPTRVRRSKLIRIKREIDNLKLTDIRTKMYRDLLIVEGVMFTWKDGHGLMQKDEDGRKRLHDLTKHDFNAVIDNILMEEIQSAKQETA